MPILGTVEILKLAHAYLLFTKRFRNILLESKCNTTFWVDPAENFRQQRNIRKGSPVFPDVIFHTEICVPFAQSHVWYQFQALVTVFSVDGTDLYKWQMRLPGWNLPVLNFAHHLLKPWTVRFAHVNGKQPLFLPKVLEWNQSKSFLSAVPTILPSVEEAISAIQASVKFVNKHSLSTGRPVKYVHVSVRCF